MIAYRCYLLDEHNKIKGAEIVECATDAAALAEAERMLPRCGYPAIEVWDKARRVGTVARSNPAPPASGVGSPQDRLLRMAVFEGRGKAGDAGSPANWLPSAARQSDP